MTARERLRHALDCALDFRGEARFTEARIERLIAERDAEHADELKERLRERLPMGYKHWADVYLDSSEADA